MSATNKTPNLDLPQWVQGDEIEREDFNDVMEIIDSMLPEMRSNANGTWVRFPTGLQLCWHSVTLHGPDLSIVGTWEFPVPFAPWINTRRFANTSIVMGAKASDGFDGSGESIGAACRIDTASFTAMGATESTYRVYVHALASGRQSDIMLWAMGRWK